MVNTLRSLEGKYVNVELVKNSLTKKLVIVGVGDYTKTDYGERLVIPVEIDGKAKDWIPNKDSVKNLHKLGIDSEAWIGKVIELNIVHMNNKEVVLGIPEVKLDNMFPNMQQPDYPQPTN